TRGEAKDGQRAVQDVGMKLHAASGNVNVQAQSDAFTLTASQAVDIQSTAASITISAPEKMLLNGGGGYIKIEGGNIEVGTSGNASFLASMKELTGGGSASPSSPALGKPAEVDTAHHLQYQAVDLQGKPLANRPYVMVMADGSIQSGKTDAAGKTKLITASRREQVQIYIEDAEHQGFRLL
ncbi:MAG: DUF2345 domain-containing protein, partial [Aquabacterium sp.]|uniref:DUF2345 domain-containing protein n=1 Tax=Aquabacterium sp. TaxID=1872578 RepID=UPI0025BCE0ED